MPFTPEELAKLVNEYRTESDDGHERLRKDFRIYHDQTETTLILLRDGVNTLRGRVELLERTPPDVAKLRFSTGVVASLVLLTASVVGAGYGFGSLVSGKIDVLSKRIDDQAASAAKLTEERSAAAQRSIDALTRQMELLKYEQQRLREDVTKTKGPRT
jgi:polyhydroxyalkanoate synthesis regulator phasin